MKNKILVLALLVLFVSVLFTSCGGDSPKMVKEVNVQAVGNISYVLTWEAVGKNVLYYEVLASQEDRASIFQIAGSINNISDFNDFEDFGLVTNQFAITPSGNNITISPNTNVDKWYALIDRENFVPVSGKYYFGVRTISTNADYSNIKWTKDTWDLISYITKYW
jgi:hypothetical protein